MYPKEMSSSCCPRTEGRTEDAGMSEKMKSVNQTKKAEIKEALSVWHNFLLTEYLCKYRFLRMSIAMTFTVTWILASEIIPSSLSRRGVRCRLYTWVTSIVTFSSECALTNANSKTIPRDDAFLFVFVEAAIVSSGFCFCLWIDGAFPVGLNARARVHFAVEIRIAAKLISLSFVHFV